jgi:hypothetical protein
VRRPAERLRPWAAQSAVNYQKFLGRRSCDWNSVGELLPNPIDSGHTFGVFSAAGWQGLPFISRVRILEHLSISIRHIFLERVIHSDAARLQARACAPRSAGKPGLRARSRRCWRRALQSSEGQDTGFILDTPIFGRPSWPAFFVSPHDPGVHKLLAAALASLRCRASAARPAVPILNPWGSCGVGSRRRFW